MFLIRPNPIMLQNTYHEYKGGGVGRDPPYSDFINRPAKADLVS
jgi:hypothetical protein